ncbi:hypothetical protein AYO20_09038 [Fonsecaea nubica]|uniref:BTB domain-containing protein n=1 Tax=Fonsecaea nubica TaxID=856822 RepID=A0A178CKC7_9EURO|nr:hypothetical protein AYO20_09038 [Fonsecaea nubica]OAL29746.1 hypothetical protein AYO20_09038 [Fonsecaea nubica]
MADLNVRDANLPSPSTRTNRKRNASAMDPDENAQEKRNVKLVEIMPSGGVVFRVGTGDDVLDIRVSGTVVSVASEEFSRMLLFSRNEGNTKVICLPEDDPKITQSLLEIFHHKGDLDHLDGVQLIKLTTAAAKWLCIPALRPWILMRLASVIETFHGNYPQYWKKRSVAEDRAMQARMQRVVFPDAAILLHAATVFRLERLFWQMTRVLIYSGATCLVRDLKKMSDSENISAVMGLINATSKRYKSNFLLMIVECIGRETAKTALTYQFNKYGYLMLQLKFHELTPHVETTNVQTVHLMVCKVREMAATLISKNITWKSLQDEACVGDCAYCKRDFAEELRKAVNDFIGNMPGICLGCFLSKREGCLSTSEDCTQCTGTTR